MIKAAAEMAAKIGSKTISDDTIAEIVQDMEAGKVVEEVEYEATEMIEHEEGTEEVIYVGGKTQSVFTPKKKEEEARSAFWKRIRPEVIEEEEEVEVGQGEPGTDQQDIMFGARDLDDPGYDSPTPREPRTPRKQRESGSQKTKRTTEPRRTEIQATPTQEGPRSRYDEGEVEMRVRLR